LVKWLGYDVVGEFGPDEMTPTQLAELAALKPNLIIDNLHMPQGQGFAELSKETKRIELRSYPDANLQSIQDILRYNATQLELIQSS
jgi:zinc transport system substrate-binding protein